MHSLAKVMLAGIGIFFAIRITPMTIQTLAFTVMKPSLESIMTCVFSLLFFVLCLAVLLYLFLYRGKDLAKKIVGTDDLPEPKSQIQWLPVAFRLLSVTAGLFCLNWTASHIIFNLNRFFIYKGMHKGAGIFIKTPIIATLEQLLGWLIMLTVGIYLLCGAPHFVRWQVKKTLHQCKNYDHLNRPAAAKPENL